MFGVFQYFLHCGVAGKFPVRRSIEQRPVRGLYILTGNFPVPAAIDFFLILSNSGLHVRELDWDHDAAR